MKYFISGNAGSGKSSTIKELGNRGFNAYDTDEITNASVLTDKKTGEEVPWPRPPIDWNRYSYDWRSDKIKEILDSEETIFLGGIVGNQEDFYSLFDKIFVLSLDSEIIKHRILTRTSKDYGKHPEQLAGILQYHKTLERKLLSEANSVTIDASQPLEKVVDEIINCIAKG